MKVAIYARVSMEEMDQADRRYQEPENQLAPLREWARTRGWEVFKEYVDRGSGADPNRPEFRRLLQDGMMMRFNCILVWRLDRFSRETMSQVVGRIYKLKERGVGVMSYHETWLDTTAESPVSELILAVMSWAAAEERRKISDRTKAGIQRQRNLGIYKGGRPKKVPPSSAEEKRSA